jgi:hypothetical protein
MKALKRGEDDNLKKIFHLNPFLCSYVLMLLFVKLSISYPCLAGGTR